MGQHLFSFPCYCSANQIVFFPICLELVLMQSFSTLRNCCAVKLWSNLSEGFCLCNLIKINCGIFNKKDTNVTSSLSAFKKV